jgi:DNA ligase (NAD+)
LLTKITAPTNCPSCESILERVKDQLFCRNSSDCSAQSTKKLQQFCKKLKIKGFGEKTLEKLGLKSINDLALITIPQLQKAGLSDHMANKLFNVVKDRMALGISPNDFLAACSIPMIGDGAMRKLEFDFVDYITYNLCTAAGIGDKAAKSLIKWIELEWNDLQPLWEQHFTLTTKSQTPVATVSNGYILCITGKLNDFKSRGDATTYLEEQGYEVKKSVTKAVTHLISEDGDTSKSSYTKALTNGVTITTIKELLEDNK